jgi:hypothetical protein
VSEISAIHARIAGTPIIKRRKYIVRFLSINHREYNLRIPGYAKGKPSISGLGMKGKKYVYVPSKFKIIIIGRKINLISD